MGWQPVVYACCFGSLLATGVAGAFSPFWRKRNAARSGGLMEGTLPLVIGNRAESADQSAEVSRETDRISQAIRQWSAERASVDLAFTAAPATLAESAPPALTSPAAMSGVLTAESEPVTSKFSRTDEPPMKEHQDSSEPESRAIAEANPFLDMDFTGAPNFYEVLQISVRADLETIHRVYRIMAARFHPDNPVSGDHEMFLQLCEAYEVLSKPERRALYDQALRAREAEPNPVFENRIFVDGLDAELNRRFGILALLYQCRRTNSGNQGLSTLELEVRMSLPREHLEFTLWYLRHKGYVQVLEANSDYAITPVGVDYVESKAGRNQILRELLTAGSSATKRASHPPRFRSKTARQPTFAGAVSV